MKVLGSGENRYIVEVTSEEMTALRKIAGVFPEDWRGGQDLVVLPLLQQCAKVGWAINYANVLREVADRLEGIKE